MAINLKQGLGLAIVAVSVLAVSTTQLTDLFGPDAAKKIAAGAVMLNGILGGWITVIAGTLAPGDQAQQLLTQPGGARALVESVLSMPGVQKIDVNQKAGAELAQAAVDPTLPKIAPTPQAEAAVNRTAAAMPATPT